jgi:hypothetical protein
VGIERISNGSALIVFGYGEPLVVGSVRFRRRDIDEMVEASENARQSSPQS